MCNSSQPTPHSPPLPSPLSRVHSLEEGRAQQHMAVIPARGRFDVENSGVLRPAWDRHTDTHTQHYGDAFGMWLQGKASLSVVEIKNGVLFSTALPFVTSSNSRTQANMHTAGEPMLVAAGGGWFMSLEQITFFLFSLTVAHGVVPPTHTRVPFLVHPLKTCSLGSVLNPVKQTMKTNHYE